MFPLPARSCSSVSPRLSMCDDAVGMSSPSRMQEATIELETYLNLPGEQAWITASNTSSLTLSLLVLSHLRSRAIIVEPLSRQWDFRSTVSIPDHDHNCVKIHKRGRKNSALPGGWARSLTPTLECIWRCFRAPPFVFAIEGELERDDSWSREVVLFASNHQSLSLSGTSYHYKVSSKKEFFLVQFELCQLLYTKRFIVSVLVPYPLCLYTLTLFNHT